MSGFRQLILLFSIPLIIISCEEDQGNPYNPNIESVSGLEYEFSVLKSSMRSSLFTCDTVRTELYAKRAINSIDNLVSSLSILQEKGARLYNDELSASEKTRLDRVTENMENAYAEWDLSSRDLNTILKKNVQVLISYNSLKYFIADPDYNDDGKIGKTSAAATVFTNNIALNSLSYFTQRTDYESLSILAEHFSFVYYKLYPFSLKGLEMYEYKESYHSLGASSALKQAYASINNSDEEQNILNVTLYNLVIRKNMRLITENRSVEFSELVRLTENIDKLYTLRFHYSVLDGAYNFLFNDLEELKAISDTLIYSSNTLAAVANGNELFEAFYLDDLRQFQYVKQMAHNIPLLCGWKEAYENYKSVVETLYAKYENDTTVSSEDEVLILAFEGEKKALVDEFEANEAILYYPYSFAYSQIDVDIQGYVEWKRLILIEKLSTNE